VSHKIQHFFSCWSQTLLLHASGYYFSAAERLKVIKILKNILNQQEVIILNPESFRVT
jgi:hypothetical protein